MDVSAKYRLGIWGLVILAVLNLGLVGVLWYEHFDNRPPRPDREEGPDASGFFVRELGLNQVQADSLLILNELHMRESVPIKGHLLSLRGQMIEELFAVSPDTARVRELSEAIGAEQAVFERVVHDHFERVRQLCGPEQQDRLKRLVMEALERAQMPPPPPPGPDGRFDHPEGRRPPPPEGQLPPPGDGRPPPPRGGR